MNKKSWFLGILLTATVVSMFFVDYFMSNDVNDANMLYKIYLKGEEIGYINDDQELYDLINEGQQEIKEKYNVNNVYPPSDFEIIKVNTYNQDVVNVKDLYKQIDENDSFTVKGYTVTIKPTNEEDSIKTINVLDESLFDESIQNFVSAFIDVNTYNDYLEDSQDEIIDTGELIEAMYFDENVTIKENYISVDDKIYTDVNELSQYLLFGEDAELVSYNIKQGDTIESISYENELNVKEFLIANPSYRNESTLLRIGDTVNVTLVNPILNFIYEVRRISEVEQEYVNKTEVDTTKAPNYEEVTQAGVSGIRKITETFQVTNGLPSQETKILQDVVVREVVDQITTTGTRYNYTPSGSSSLQHNLDLGWPVLPSAIITSYYGEFRFGAVHTGLDFSGTGEKSPIYAVADGIVTQAGKKGDAGNYVVIDHGDNIFTSYMHMYDNTLLVSVGDVVTKGQQLGGMGNTGLSTGTHLHITFSEGEPYKVWPKYYDPYPILLGR